MRVEERLLKYVSYWTTSDEECRQIPSSERQFELGKVLEQELRDLGLEKVTLTDHCYVYGLLIQCRETFRFFALLKNQVQFQA